MIQQRQGRVRAPGNGLVVVQDRVLEAEADRLGMRAASHRVAVRACADFGGLRPAIRQLAAGPRYLVQLAAAAPVGGKAIRAAAAAAKKVSAAAAAVNAPAKDSQMKSGAPISARSTGGSTSGAGGVHAMADGKPYIGKAYSKPRDHAEAQICWDWSEKAKKAEKTPEALKAKKQAARSGGAAAAAAAGSAPASRAKKRAKAGCAAPAAAAAGALASSVTNIKTISIDAWPCADCDALLLRTAKALKMTIVVTVTDDSGLYSKGHALTKGLKGTITYT